MWIVNADPYHEEDGNIGGAKANNISNPTERKAIVISKEERYQAFKENHWCFGWVDVAENYPFRVKNYYLSAMYWLIRQQKGWGGFEDWN